MKVWIVVIGYEFQGYELPVGVYSTLALAEAAEKKAKAENADAWETYIFEYEIDATIVAFELPKEV